MIQGWTLEEVLAYEQLFTVSFKAEPEKTMSQKSSVTKLKCIFLDFLKAVLTFSASGKLDSSCQVFFFSRNCVGVSSFKSLHQLRHFKLDFKTHVSDN